MNKKEFIVLIPVDFKKSYEVAQAFMGKEFKQLGDVATSITEALTEDESEEDEEVLVYSIEGFARAINNQEFESMSNYYTASVYVV